MLILLLNALTPGAIFRSRLGAFTPAQAPRQACPIVQFQCAVRPVEHEKTEGTENFWRWERVFDMELSRFTEWRVGVGFAHRGEFKASLRLLCFLQFPPEWLTAR